MEQVQDSKLTKEQLSHFVKGGMFKAIYSPKKTYDITNHSKLMIGREIIVYQNIINSPIMCVTDYRGQHAFNSRDIKGWFPEEDIEIIEMLNDYIDVPQTIPQYLYLLTYTKKKQLKNFGKNNYKLPLIVGREYSNEVDEYVKELSNPKATKIEKAVWTGVEKYSGLKWKTIFEK